jgi:hypothetical protein
VRPRYRLWGDDRQAVSVRGEIGVSREITDSDVTTRRGESSLTDAVLMASYAATLWEGGPIGPAPLTADAVGVDSTPSFATVLLLRLPVITLPTSTASSANGTRVGIGITAGVAQSLPVLGLDSRWLPAADLDVSAGYAYLFTEATEPTGRGFSRMRMSPEGATVVSDQLGGAAFAQHQLSFGIGGTIYVTRHLSWSSSIGMRPSFRYGFREDTEICSVVDTGCVTVTSAQDPERYALVTQLESGVGVRAIEAVGIWIGYGNVTLQLGPDGRRRNVAYSPDARFELAVTLHLDALWGSVAARTGPTLR